MRNPLFQETPRTIKLLFLCLFPSQELSSYFRSHDELWAHSLDNLREILPERLFSGYWPSDHEEMLYMLLRKGEIQCPYSVGTPINYIKDQHGDMSLKVEIVAFKSW